MTCLQVPKGPRSFDAAAEVAGGANRINGGCLRSIYGGTLRLQDTRNPTRDVTSSPPRRPPESAGAVECAARSRKPRADAQRNRDGLLERRRRRSRNWARRPASTDRAARKVGTARSTATSRLATRSWRRSIAGRSALSDAAPRLVEALPPAEALRAWMGVFVHYIAAKKVIAAGSKIVGRRGWAGYADSSARINGAIARLVEARAASGDIRRRRRILADLLRRRSDRLC